MKHCMCIEDIACLAKSEAVTETKPETDVCQNTQVHVYVYIHPHPHIPTHRLGISDGIIGASGAFGAVFGIVGTFLFPRLLACTGKYI